MAKIKHPHQLKATRSTKSDQKLCLYVDNSNIFIEGQRLAEKRGEDRALFRIYFENFLKLCAQGRRVHEVVWGGSIPPPNDDVWTLLRDGFGIQPDLLDRAESGEGNTVDHLIQLRMHRHVRKYREKPGTIILCTGDGKGYHREEGFLYDVEGFVEDGWKLELVSWTHCCHRDLRRFAETEGTFVPLERFYDSITFVERGRKVMALDLNDLWRK